jgi:hypothetical protein
VVCVAADGKNKDEIQGTAVLHSVQDDGFNKKGIGYIHLGFKLGFAPEVTDGSVILLRGARVAEDWGRRDAW